MTLARFLRLAVVGSVMLLTVDASAQSIDDARTAFAEGRFVEATNIGGAIGTSESYALAAQSLAVYARYEASEEEWDAIIQRAMWMGESAIEANPNNPEAHYQAAHALGVYADKIGKAKAFFGSTVGDIKSLLESALALDPDLASAHMILGGWHAGIDDAGRVARFRYGGSRDDAIHHLERALELAPESKDVLLRCGMEFPRLYEDDGVERARALLTKAAAIPSRDVWEAYLQEEIEAELEALEGR